MVLRDLSYRRVTIKGLEGYKLTFVLFRLGLGENLKLFKIV